MKISKKLEWLRDYFEIGMTYISPGKEITRLTAWDHTKSRGKDCHACVIRDREGAPYRIYMHTHCKDTNRNFVKYTKIEMLTYLAHEMAHVEHWNHTPEHKKLEAKLLNRFMTKLKKDGYVSEEKESIAIKALGA